MERNDMRVFYGISISVLILIVLFGCTTTPSTDYEKPSDLRAWTYATGSRIYASYDEYKDGIVYLVQTNGQRRSVRLAKLSGKDQEFVKKQFSKPRGALNEVTLLGWKNEVPSFVINASYFQGGERTRSPYVNIDYLLEKGDGTTGVGHCPQTPLYGQTGRMKPALATTSVMRNTQGLTVRPDPASRVLAYRAVLLLDHGGKTLVLDTYNNQNDANLKASGISIEWWR